MAGVEEQHLSSVGKELKAIVDEAKQDLRREMRYLLIIGVAAGNVVAAFVVTKVQAAAPARETAAAAARFLFGL